MSQVLKERKEKRERGRGEGGGGEKGRKNAVQNKLLDFLLPELYLPIKSFVLLKNSQRSNWPGIWNGHDWVGAACISYLYWVSPKVLLNIFRCEISRSDVTFLILYIRTLKLKVPFNDLLSHTARQPAELTGQVLQVLVSYYRATSALVRLSLDSSKMTRTSCLSLLNSYITLGHT